MKVLQFDHQANYLRDKAEIDSAIERVLSYGNPIMGPEVRLFEKAFARLVGVPFAVGVMSGTAALTLAVASFGIGNGDEVITVANSDTPTSHAISITGASPVWVDIDPDTYNILPAAIEAAFSRTSVSLLWRTFTVVPAHTGDVVARSCARPWSSGDRRRCPCDWGGIQGASGGSLGDVAAFSTAPAKVLGGTAVAA